ncbi:MAG: hypothetical protein DHS20C18_54270 [Saprospiraceae bacterium]|nr:MAG: hypothetical protein DHS20C18_54270 [Saprospiraceae bacterium]
MFKSPTYSLALILLITTFFAFFRLGDHPLEIGDESRGGINALEMLANGDWVNLHYCGEPDGVRAKPPLFIWTVATSMHFFGANEWALRIPSALYIIAVFFLIFKLITLYQSHQFAFWTCLLLLSVSGLVGHHVGRTGDFDAMLLMFLLGGLYHLLRFLDFGNSRAIYWTGLFWGLAFMVKGLAAGTLIPGVLLYMVLSGRLLATLRKRQLWIGAAIGLLFPLGWFLAVQQYGIVWENPEYTGSNVFERLIVHDILERFTQSDFEGRVATSDHNYIFYSLDKTFNLWNFIFWGFMAFGLYRLVKDRKSITRLMLSEKHRLLLLSLSLWFPLAVFLSFVAHALRQYIVPVVPFVGIATMIGICWLWGKYHWPKYIFFILLTFTLGRRLHFFATPHSRPPIAKEQCDYLKDAKAIYVENKALQDDELLYLYFCNQHNLYFENIASQSDYDYYFVRKETYENGSHPDKKVVAEMKEGLLLKLTN